MNLLKQTLIERLTERRDAADAAFETFQRHLAADKLAAFRRCEWAVNAAALSEECSRVIDALQREDESAVSVEEMRGYLNDNIRNGVRYCATYNNLVRSAQMAAVVEIVEIFEREIGRMAVNVSKKVGQ